MRADRLGPTVAAWFLCRADDHRAFTVDAIDLADFELPGDLGGGGDAAAFDRRIVTADAFVVVTPEYNHGYPGPLKTAIDTAREAWHAKPVAFVSYGGSAGGLRAVEQLRLVFAELHAVTIRDTVSFHAAHRQFAPDGEPIPKTADRAALALLDRLAWWASALGHARTRHPYAA